MAQLGGVATIGMPSLLSGEAVRLMLGSLLAALLSAVLVVRVGGRDLLHLGRRRFLLAALAMALIGISVGLIGRIIATADLPGLTALLHREGLRQHGLFWLREAPTVVASILAILGSRAVRCILHRHRLSLLIWEPPAPVGQQVGDVAMTSLPPMPHVPSRAAASLPPAGVDAVRPIALRTAGFRHPGLTPSVRPPTRRYGRPLRTVRALPAARRDAAGRPSARAPHACQ